MLAVKNMSKAYGRNHVLRSLSVEFRSGEVAGIVGANGAGKTTLFRCIAELEMHEGDVDSDINPLKNKLGFLATDPYFFNMITGREYLRLMCTARSLPTPDLDARNIFQLPLDQYAATYSTGMKKKLALLGILLQENDIYILDEPFNGVDIQSNILITAIIQKLKALGKTLIVSSHIFSSLRDICDIIHHLDEGIIKTTVTSQQFSQLEDSMRQTSIGNEIDLLDLK